MHCDIELNRSMQVQGGAAQAWPEQWAENMSTSKYITKTPPTCNGNTVAIVIIILYNNQLWNAEMMLVDRVQARVHVK